MVPGRTVVDGRFELLGPLGSGGMGTVWRAYDLALHREVALKEVRADPQSGSGSSPAVQRERVLREARALARIGHPNVVTVHHIIDAPAPAHPWIVMELVRGRTLAEHLAEGPLTSASAAQIGRGILAALRAAHSVGVLHRDIKPANVMLREDGTPVLTDFGIAAITGLNGLTSTGHLVGSLDYVAPERLGGHEGHPASDLWSLGLVLYVAVEGYHPMSRDTPVATLAAVLKGSVPPPHRAGPLTPVLQALLVPDPDHRPIAEQVDQMLARVIATHESATEWSMQPPAPPIPWSGVERGYARPADSHPSRPPVSGPEFAGAADLHRSAQLAIGAGPAGTADPRRSQRRLLAAGLAAAAIAIIITIIVALTLRSESPGDQAISTPSASAAPTTSGSASTAPGIIIPTSNTGAATNLLTPDNIRQAIAALEKVTGGTEFTETTFYPTYVNAGAPVANQPTLYDEFTYRNGSATRARPGGEISDEGTVTLSSINWDALPSLFRTAEESLNIPAPTLRYIIVKPAWTFNNDQPTVLIYLTDDYGGAYLAATTTGTVLTLYPRER